MHHSMYFALLLSCSYTKCPFCSPLFVTWNIAAYDEKHLRGCIGNFNAMPLRRGLKEYALTR